jgi:hypothetical protein
MLFSAVCAGLVIMGFRDLRIAKKLRKQRQNSLIRMARQSEKLGEYDKFVE